MEKDFCRKKVDKEQIQKNTQEDFSLFPHRKSSNKRCLRKFLRKEKTDDFQSFFSPKKKNLTHSFLLYSFLFDLLFFSQRVRSLLLLSFVFYDFFCDLPLLILFLPSTNHLFFSNVTFVYVYVLHKIAQCEKEETKKEEKNWRGFEK